MQITGIPEEPSTPPQESYVADHSRHGEINGYLAGLLGPKFSAYRLDWDRVQSMDEVTPFPLYLSLETLFQCNFSCAMCTYSMPDEAAKQSYDGAMTDEIFSRVTNEIKEHNCPSVGMNMLNEPLLDRKIIGRIQSVHKAGAIDIRMNSNGSLLTEDRAERLVDSGLTRLMIGMDAATENAYRKVRIGGNFDKLIRNVERFLDIREKRGRKLPILRVTFVRLIHNQHETDDFIQKWIGLADQISIQEYRPPYPEEDKYKANYPAAKRITEDYTCSQPFERLTIRGNGDILPCCQQYAYKIKVGNILDRSLYDTWHSNEMDILRQHMIDRTWDQLDVCNTCLKSLIRN